MIRLVVAAVICLMLVIDGVSAQMTQALRDSVLTEHNRLRRDAIGPGGSDVVSTTTATAMLEMEYDTKLECVAQAYIETQTSGFSHNDNRTSDYAACGGSGYVGENWFSESPNTTDLAGGATRAWVDFIWPVAWGYNGCSERENYHGDRGCSGTVGHYKQVLWANSYKVGCGYTPEGGTVCNYSPGGNYPTDPFIVGAECSACPETHPFCNNGLCSKTNTSICSVGAIDLTATDTGSHEIYISESAITAGGGFVVTPALDVAFIAATQISLLGEFTIQSGAVFIAEIDPATACTP